ncbi:MAG TPA: hypothetical protein VHX14_02265 [Thermoanaerobaculia bacterium]|nr:hypothetical protein [Thermoanaerobaculia bacterium]
MSGSTHPNFTRAKINPLINRAPRKALRVRVTGMLTFDSQHFLQDSLLRVNDWEIHPILKLEYCDDDNCRRTATPDGNRSTIYPETEPGRQIDGHCDLGSP